MTNLLDLSREPETEAYAYYDANISPLASTMTDAAEILVALASVRADEARDEATALHDMTAAGVASPWASWFWPPSFRAC